jgi:hypothetical protein
MMEHITLSLNESEPLLSVAAVLPAQFYSEAVQPADGARALMLAVLKEALDCVRLQYLKSGRRVQRLAREAEEWFFTNDLHWLFSFVNICAALNLEPAAVRQQLRQWKAKNGQSLSPLQRREPARGSRQSLKLAA